MLTIDQLRHVAYTVKYAVI